MDSDTTRRRARWILLSIGIGLLAAAILLWRFSPLAHWLTPERVTAALNQFREEPWAPLAMLALFVLGGLVVMPLMLLIAATALLLDPLIAFGVSLTGSLASALATYAVGAHFVRRIAHTAFGPTLRKLDAALATQGIVAIAVIRMLPIAPFSVVNVVAGSIGVRLRDYMLGTALGVAPGLLAITAFGGQLRVVLEDPTAPRVLTLLAIVVGWIVLSLVLQRALAPHQRSAGSLRVRAREHGAGAAQWR